MKPSVQLPIVLLFFLTMSLILTAQGDSSSILGTWDFDYQASESRMDTKMKAYLAKLDIVGQDRIKRSYQGRKVTFNVDGTFVQRASDGNDVKGTWKIKEKEKVVEVTYPDGLVYPQTITLLTANRLVLVPNDIGKGQLFFPEWHFTRN